MASAIWDAHSHCTLAQAPERSTAAYWQAAMAQGLGGVIWGGIDPDDWRVQKRLREDLGPTFASSYGLHPWFIHHNEGLDDAWKALQDSLSEAQALGECGLDYFVAKDANDRHRQDVWCKRQLQLAHHIGKPVILHVVRAHEPMLGMLGGHSWQGLVHGFTANLTVAKRYVAAGLIVSLGDRISDAHLQDVLTGLPPEAWVLETDEKDLDALALMAARCASPLSTTPESILQAQRGKLATAFKGAL